MLLTIDIGNTNIKLGLFEGSVLRESWRLGSSLSKTSDEYGTAITDFLRGRGYSASDVDGVVISSVIPNLNHTFERLSGYYFGQKPVTVGPGVKTGIAIKTDDPREVGADRIVNCLAAYKLYGAPLTVIDFGTATTFNVVGERGEFTGGLIAPGIKISGDALTANAALLPKFEYELPPKIVNKNTVTNMQAGLLYGAIALVEYVCPRIKSECGFESMRVVATGGLSNLIAQGTKVIDIVDKTLTLTGLRLLYEMNRR